MWGAITLNLCGNDYIVTLDRTVPKIMKALCDALGDFDFFVYAHLLIKMPRSCMLGMIELMHPRAHLMKYGTSFFTHSIEYIEYIDILREPYATLCR